MAAIYGGDFILNKIYKDVLMDKVPEKSLILVIKGIYPKDFVQDAKPPTANRVIYTEIPKRFTSVASWIKSSNLRCWECSMKFAGYPKFIPVNPENDGIGDSCDVFGHFCEWNCAVRFAQREIPGAALWDTLRLISIFEAKFTGKMRKKILPAPSRTLMKQYCGHSGITKDQWRNRMEAVNIEYSSYSCDTTDC